MRFHISSRHLPENCGIHLEERKDGINSVASWPDRCKELGITYVAGGGCRPQHDHFMFVETDDIAKVADLMRPMQGRNTVVITPVEGRE